MTTGRAVQSALDIGHGTVRVIIAERVEEDRIRVLGAGAAASKGLSRGIPTNIKPMILAVEEAIAAAEEAASIEVEDIHLGVSGAELACAETESHLLVTRNPQDPRSSLIQPLHLRQVLEQAESSQSVQIERQILHCLPQEFLVDGAEGVTNPVGLHGMRLDCRTHFLSVPVNTVENLKRCVQRTAVNVGSVTLTSLAASCFLSPDEKELGVLLLDIGAASTDLILHADGKVCHAASVPMGGAAITSDITRAFRTPSSEAERIKRSYGCCDHRQIRRDERFDIDFAGGDASERASRSQLCQVIQPRMEEILEQVERELELSNMRWMLGAGVVITGGGARLDGLIDLVRDRWSLPVRLGYPRGVMGVEADPSMLEWAPAIGLAQHALRNAPISHGQKNRVTLWNWVNRLRRHVAL
jgi:cell division protein FtsA